MYDRILLPTDGSDASNRAVEEAIGLAEATGAELHVLFVVEDIPYAPEMMDDEVEARIRKSARTPSKRFAPVPTRPASKSSPTSKRGRRIRLSSGTPTRPTSTPS